MRMRKKPNLAARMEKCANMLVAEPEKLRGMWLDEFGYDELHIELGCGKGRFTVETAKAEAATTSGVTAGTGTVFIAALEKSADAMIVAVERAAAVDLRNIRFVNGYAEHLTKLFAPCEASRIYLNFCDPWPSNRHSKRRLTNRRFVELYLQILKTGGEIHFKTDNLSLFEYSLREFSSSGLGLLEVTRDLHRDGPAGVMTDYEQKFYDQGLPIHRCIACK